MLNLHLLNLSCDRFDQACKLWSPNFTVIIHSKNTKPRTLSITMTVDLFITQADCDLFVHIVNLSKSDIFNFQNQVMVR